MSFWIVTLNVWKPGVTFNPVKLPGTTLSAVKRRQTSLLLICLCWPGAQPLRCKFIYVPSGRSATRRLSLESLITVGLFNSLSVSLIDSDNLK